MFNALTWGGSMGIEPKRTLRAGRVFRQCREPEPLLTAIDLLDAGRRIVTAIEQMHHARQVGAYLFADALRQVYVVDEDRAWMRQCLREFHRHAWRDRFVGFYRLGGCPLALRPDAQGIAEDLGEHWGIEP